MPFIKLSLQLHTYVYIVPTTPAEDTAELGSSVHAPGAPGAPGRAESSTDTGMGTS